MLLSSGDLRLAKWLGLTIVPSARWYRPLHRRTADSTVMWAVKVPIRLLHSLRWVAIAIARARRLRSLHAREKSRHPLAISPDSGCGFGLARCDIRYINLQSRTDRREQFVAEMQSLEISEYKRVAGVIASPATLGCALAHVKALESWEPNPSGLLLVCEDDVEFVADREDIDRTIEEFFLSPELKVLMLAHNAAWHIPITDRLGISSDVVTAAAYVVRVDILQELLAVFRRSAEMLKNGAPSHQAAVDVVWREVQKDQLFAICTPRCAIQRPGYSDVEQAMTDYGV